MLERLKNVHVPPPPEDIELRVHHRLNWLILTSHLIEFCVRTVPFAVIHLSRAALALLVFSLTGQYDLFHKKGRNYEERNDQ